MTILLDECVPRRLCQYLTGHHCQTARQAGLAGKRNGELLRLAEKRGYDVLLTVDQNLPYQQRIEGRRIAVLVLCARSNRVSYLLPLVPECLAAVEVIAPGQLIRVPDEIGLRA